MCKVLAKAKTHLGGAVYKKENQRFSFSLQTRLVWSPYMCKDKIKDFIIYHTHMCEKSRALVERISV